MEEEEKKVVRGAKVEIEAGQIIWIVKTGYPLAILNFSIQMIWTNQMGYSVCKLFVPTDGPVS